MHDYIIETFARLRTIGFSRLMARKTSPKYIWWQIWTSTPPPPKHRLLSYFLYLAALDEWIMKELTTKTGAFKTKLRIDISPIL